MSDTCSNCDTTLFHLLKECKTLPVFLDAVFGFLKRRTDFYVIAKEANSAVGLPPRVAENIVKDAFFRWQMDNAAENFNFHCDSPTTPMAIEEVEVCDDLIVPTPHEPNGIDSGTQAANGTLLKSPLPAECYNGAITDNYMWSQSINELDITVSLEADVGPKDLLIQFDGKQVTVKKKNAHKETVFAGQLLFGIKHTEAIWWVEKENHKLQLHLDKVQERWWDRLLIDDEPLDLAKLDCTRPFDELPEEAQAKIAELQFNQDRLRAGGKTTQQIRMEATLKRAWNVDGSPFSGPFDPTGVITE